MLSGSHLLTKTHIFQCELKPTVCGFPGQIMVAGNEMCLGAEPYHT